MSIFSKLGKRIFRSASERALSGTAAKVLERGNMQKYVGLKSKLIEDGPQIRGKIGDLSRRKTAAEGELRSFKSILDTEKDLAEDGFIITNPKSGSHWGEYLEDRLIPGIEKDITDATTQLKNMEEATSVARKEVRDSIHRFRDRYKQTAYERVPKFAGDVASGVSDFATKKVGHFITDKVVPVAGKAWRVPGYPGRKLVKWFSTAPENPSVYTFADQPFMRLFREAADLLPITTVSLATYFGLRGMHQNEVEGSVASSSPGDNPQVSTNTNSSASVAPVIDVSIANDVARRAVDKFKKSDFGPDATNELRTAMAPIYANSELAATVRYGLLNQKFSELHNGVNLEGYDRAARSTTDAALQSKILNVLDQFENENKNLGIEDLLLQQGGM